MSTIKVVMVGASRSGKTSILASMLEGCKRNLSKYGLALRAENDDSSFRDAINDMSDLCDDTNASPRMTSLRGNQLITEYSFRLSYLNAPSEDKNKIVVYDIPGEWYDQKTTDQLDLLEPKIKESQILIVAVDTPALLWTKGEGQVYQNLISCKDTILELMPHLGTVIDEDREVKCLKSIIFTPIKCENYLHKDADKFYSDISAAIKSVYSDVLEKAKTGRYRVTILPMETIGGVEFHKYSDSESMGVLTYSPDLDTSTYKQGREIEDIRTGNDGHDGEPILNSEGEFILKKITRCEVVDDTIVTIARTGKHYTLKDGDVLKPTSEMGGYPYVYSKGKPIPYIWYKPNGRGFHPKNCEKVLYEVIRITIQQIASSSRIDVNTLINKDFGFFERMLLMLIGRLDSYKQMKELCKSLKSMCQDGVFKESIVLLNNIDSDPTFKIRFE